MEEINLTKGLAERLGKPVTVSPETLTVQQLIQKATAAIIEALLLTAPHLLNEDHERLCNLLDEVEDPSWIQSS